MLVRGASDGEVHPSRLIKASKARRGRCAPSPVRDSAARSLSSRAFRLPFISCAYSLLSPSYSLPSLPFPSFHFVFGIRIRRIPLHLALVGTYRGWVRQRRGRHLSDVHNPPRPPGALRPIARRTYTLVQRPRLHKRCRDPLRLHLHHARRTAPRSARACAPVLPGAKDRAQLAEARLLAHDSSQKARRGGARLRSSAIAGRMEATRSRGAVDAGADSAGGKTTVLGSDVMSRMTRPRAPLACAPCPRERHPRGRRPYGRAARSNSVASSAAPSAATRARPPASITRAFCSLSGVGVQHPSRHSLPRPASPPFLLHQNMPAFHFPSFPFVFIFVFAPLRIRLNAASALLLRFRPVLLAGVERSGVEEWGLERARALRVPSASSFLPPIHRFSDEPRMCLYPTCGCGACGEARVSPNTVELALMECQCTFAHI
ncbi:hypothetical protein FB451DRAFT_1515675 [Mycena latifolia]|nr:hypothetical protein FB451DRAFT_1515675 [Mycena latifolia]